MEAWITAEDIIKNGILSEINLIYLVNKGEITPYNKNNFEEVNFDFLKKRFEKIQELYNIFNFKKIKLKTGQKKISWDMLYAILSFWDEVSIEAPEDLRKTSPINFNYDQHKQILAGWDNNITREIIFESVFKEREISDAVDKIFLRNQQRDEGIDSPQLTKSRNTFLKIIGAFIEIKYLHPTKTKNTYMIGDKPSAQAIAEKFYQELAEVGIGDEGIKSRTLRKIIPEALDAIEQNKTDKKISEK